MSHTNPQFIIYVLHHPQSDHIYVGKSEKGMRRPREHSFPSSLSRYAHLPRTKWIKSLRGRGLEPEIAVVEECTTPEELNEAEQFHVANFKFLGISLLNCTDGGDGISGWRHDSDAIAKMSAKNKERTATDEGRARMGSMSRDAWADPEIREKRLAARIGKKKSAETRAKMSATATGKPKSAEHRANLSKAMQVASATPEWREKQREVQRIAQSRPEVVAKKSEAAKLAWDRRKRGAPS